METLINILNAIWNPELVQDPLYKALAWFTFISLELLVLFLAISAAVAFVLQFISDEQMKKWLTRGGVWGNVIGATIGAITPFCACSTIPLTLGLLNAGAPFAPVMSFVISSPILNPIIIAMIYAFVGIKGTVVYFAVTFAAAVIFGELLEKMGGHSLVKNVRLKKSCCSVETHTNSSFWQKVASACKTAWSDFKGVFIYLIIGVAIGAGIYGYMPEEFIVRIAGPQNPLAIPLAALIGVPLYIRAETAIPIGIALASRGMSIGAVIALIIGGAGMAIPEMSLLASIFKRKLVAATVLVIFATATIAGYTFDWSGISAQTDTTNQHIIKQEQPQNIQPQKGIQSNSNILNEKQQKS